MGKNANNEQKQTSKTFFKQHPIQEKVNLASTSEPFTLRGTSNCQIQQAHTKCNQILIANILKIKQTT
jgi:hypothetical protein